MCWGVRAAVPRWIRLHVLSKVWLAVALFPESKGTWYLRLHASCGNLRLQGVFLHSPLTISDESLHFPPLSNC